MSESMTIADSAHATCPSLILLLGLFFVRTTCTASYPVNGNFTGPVDAKTHAPKGWSQSPGTGGKGTADCAVVNEAPWPDGKSMKCVASGTNSDYRSSYLHSDPTPVRPGQTLQVGGDGMNHLCCMVAGTLHDVEHTNTFR